MTWKPISSAPRDGRSILGFMADELDRNGNPITIQVCWNVGFEQFTAVMDLEPIHDLTHWMELLDAPKEQSMDAIVRAPTLPDGFVLVPKEPTSAMQDAVESMKLPHALLRTGVRLADFRERYAAMLAASPEVKL